MDVNDDLLRAFDRTLRDYVKHGVDHFRRHRAELKLLIDTVIAQYVFQKTGNAPRNSQSAVNEVAALPKSPLRDGVLGVMARYSFFVDDPYIEEDEVDSFVKGDLIRLLQAIVDGKENGVAQVLRLTMQRVSR